MDKARTDVEFAIAYGRNCRKVFGGEAWNVAIRRIRVTWETIPVDMDGTLHFHSFAQVGIWRKSSDQPPRLGNEKDSRHVAKYRQTSLYVDATRDRVRLHSKTARHAFQTLGAPWEGRRLVCRLLRVRWQSYRQPRTSGWCVQAMQLLLGSALMH